MQCFFLVIYILCFMRVMEYQILIIFLFPTTTKLPPAAPSNRTLLGNVTKTWHRSRILRSFSTSQCTAPPNRRNVVKFPIASLFYITRLSSTFGSSFRFSVYRLLRRNANEFFIYVRLEVNMNITLIFDITSFSLVD